MTVPLHLFQLELLGATTGFILGRSKVGDRLYDTAPSWVSYRPRITSIDMDRDASAGPLGTAPDAGTLTVTFYDRRGVAGLADDLNIRPNVPVRLTVAGIAMFTGVIRDLSGTTDRDGSDRLTLTAVDAAGVLANTTRYGAISGEGSEPFTARIERLARSSSIPIDIDTVTSTQLANSRLSWAAFGGTPTGVGSSTVEDSYYWNPDATLLMGQGVTHAIVPTGSGNWTIPAYTLGMQRTLTGLVVGRTYRVVAEVTDSNFAAGMSRPVLGIVGKAWGAPRVTPRWEGVGGWKFIEIDVVFTATATSHTLQFARADIWIGSKAAPTNYNGIDVRAVRIEEYAPASRWRLADIGREGSLANHLTIACDSAGGYWWPQRDELAAYVTDRLDKTVRLQLSDTAVPSYTGINASWDTRNVVNDLRVNNLGYDPDTGNSADQSYTQADDVSAATYGYRSASVELSVYTTDVNEGDLAERVSELLASVSASERGPSSVAVRPTDVLADLAQLDLFDLIKITRAGATYDRRVQKIHHRITARQWTADLGLRKDT